MNSDPIDIIPRRPRGPQEQFMESCGQTTKYVNFAQVELYMELIREEVVRELFPAILSWLESPMDKERVKAVLDGAGDSLVVLHGLLHSMGQDPWIVKSRIDASNLTKIPRGSESVARRGDGKILKPSTYQPPVLDDLAEEVIHTIGRNKGYV